MNLFSILDIDGMLYIVKANELNTLVVDVWASKACFLLHLISWVNGISRN